MDAALPRHDVVLLGVGHTHAHVVRMWRMHRPEDARLTCVSDFPVATYSGMLPGVLAGQYPRERMQIDLVRLCASSGARLVVGQVTGLDLRQRRIVFSDRPSLPFDVLSIGIGSQPRLEAAVSRNPRVVPIKPMQTLLDRLERRLGGLRSSGAELLRVAIVGGGAGGVEIAFCLPRRVAHRFAEVELTLIDAHRELLGNASPGLRQRVRRSLTRRGVRLELGRAVVEVEGGSLVLADGQHIETDLALWATGAAPPELLERLDLPTDERGFLRTGATLQVEGCDRIFAVGDTGTLAGQPTPKAGVYAVRQGPILWDNICRSLRGGRLQAYRPQRGVLKLLNTGDGGAIGEYRGWSFQGRWCWQLKDRIDGQFIGKYQDYRPMGMTSTRHAEPAPLRCAGCGGKVGGSVLARALSRLEIPPHPAVRLGLEQPDDAALLQFGGDLPLAVTNDFFAAPLDDPYVVGRIAAQNAASDLFAVGALPAAALAMVTVPPGRPEQQEQLLYELLAGGLEELRRLGATLIGGHSIEGPQLIIGYTVLGPQQGPPRLKDALRAGDQLILTKALGTGALLAAQMRAECTAAWFDPLLESMLASNRAAAEVAQQHDVRALTDVTGFGLAGHLLEMLRASRAAARLTLASIPLLPGFAEVWARGLESTLAPANRVAEAAMRVAERRRDEPQFAALFDPQTGGGMLRGVPPASVEAVLDDLSGRGVVAATRVGEVVAAEPGRAAIELV